jgi:hypothetical protein
METSPGGPLLATALDGDDEVPHLSLDDPGPSEERQLSHVVRVQLDDEDEEDATPRPTPISISIQLPLSDDALLCLVSTRWTNTIPEKTQPIGHDVEQAIVNENFPDPDLLPLPEFDPRSSIVEVMRTSTNDSEDEPTKIEPRPSSQMPTPPASPPSLYPALLSQRKAGKSLPPSPMTGPRNLIVAIDVKSRSKSASPHALQLALPADVPEEKHDNPMQGVSVPCPTLLTAESTENPLSGHAENDAEETSKQSMELGEIGSTTKHRVAIPR